MRLSVLLDLAAARLRAAGCDAPRKEARLLLAHLLETDPGALAAPPPEAALDSPAQGEAFERLIARREKREPLSQILGRQPFWSLDFLVNSHTLTPRPDSEALIEAVLAHIPVNRAQLHILDLGAGSGCLLLTLLDALPEALGLGVDISEQALRVAQANANRLGLARRVRWLRSDWAEAVNETFDIVISNPPYIETAALAGLMPEVRDYEPRAALDGGVDGLAAYRRIFDALPRLLNAGGIAALEAGAGQAEALCQLGATVGLKHLRTACDLLGIERAVLFQQP